MSKKILVVDDEREVQNLFRLKFRREMKSNQLEFTFAFSGKEAQSHIGNESFKIILSDINMPGMNGLDLLKWIKSEHDAVPVYMISAYEDEKYRIEAEELGADAFISKPVDFRKLKEILLGESA